MKKTKDTIKFIELNQKELHQRRIEAARENGVLKIRLPKRMMKLCQKDRRSKIK